jgi:hypothetical protein
MHLDSDDAGMAGRDLLESSPTLRERMFEVVDQTDTPALSRHARTELATLRFAEQPRVEGSRSRCPHTRRVTWLVT